MASGGHAQGTPLFMGSLRGDTLLGSMTLKLVSFLCLLFRLILNYVLFNQVLILPQLATLSLLQPTSALLQVNIFGVT